MKERLIKAIESVFVYLLAIVFMPVYVIHRFYIGFFDKELLCDECDNKIKYY